ncbi:polysaccharide biosynthesis tyrosine autokinase [Actinomycetospora chiangmaiensis]|uniref:polysaccharide biosynthesis tyrosine autokinase n=1 Tax=Actinomycetospora chiangmaiensis TaxID=402650 RepID=UPI000A054819|nr:polysaccharide biosynthesis tyrosine autokinase [Actinomycetospora chiangmaiensis]
MTVEDFAGAVRVHWKKLLPVVPVFLVLAAIISFVQPRTYLASADLYVSTQASAANLTSAYQGGLLSQERVKSYTELASTTRVAQDVKAAIGSQEPISEIQGDLSASANLDTVLLTVSARNSSPTTAAAMANAAADSLSRLVSDLERPSDPNAQSPIVVRQVQEAPVPESPETPNVKLNFSLAIALALVATAVLVVVLNRRDTRVRSTSELTRLTGLPLMASISKNDDLERTPLVVDSLPHSSQAEEFRQLRTNLQFANIDASSRVFVVTSSLPGEGKTTTISNLAISISDSGARVLVVDGDLRRPQLAERFSLDSSVGLTSVLANRIPLSQAIQKWGRRVDVLGSGPVPPNPSELLASNQMSLTIDKLKSQYDYILIDSPPLRAVTDAAALSPRLDGVILVARFGVVRSSDLIRSVNSVSGVGGKLLGCVFSVVPSSGRGYYGSYVAYGPRRSPSGDEPLTETIRNESPRPTPRKRDSGM